MIKMLASLPNDLRLDTSIGWGCGSSAKRTVDPVDDANFGHSLETCIMMKKERKQQQQRCRWSKKTKKVWSTLRWSNAIWTAKTQQLLSSNLNFTLEFLIEKVEMKVDLVKQSQIETNFRSAVCNTILRFSSQQQSF